MPTYVQFTKLTEAGRKKKRTGDNSKEINKEPNEHIASMGAKILHQYALLGPWDFVNIIEAPSQEVMIRLAADINAMGLATTVTMPATSIGELKDIIK